MDSRILRAIDDSQAVPSVPQVVTRVLEVTADPDSDRRDIVQALSIDAGVVSDLIRLANSALYGGSRQITAIDEAVPRLGINRIRKLVIARSLVVSLCATRTTDVDMSYFWRRSLGTAVLAAHFADALKGLDRDQAFLAGLLGDIGVVILARAVPAQYAPLAKRYEPGCDEDLHTQERDLLGVSHAEVGATALQRWSLPEEVVGAVCHHHDEPFGPDVPEPVARLAGVLCGAGELARILCQAPDPAVIVGVCERAMHKVGLDVAVLPMALGHVEAEVAELADVLRLEIIASKVYAMIAETVRQQLTVAPA